MPEERIVIGRVGAVNVAKRELRIKPEPAYDYQFNQLTRIRVSPVGGDEVRCKVTQVREAKDVYIVELGPGVPRDFVAGMKGAAVALTPEEISDRRDEDVALEAIIGMTVITAEGKPIGEVTDVLSAGGNDVAEVYTPDGSRFMFPVVPESVKEMNLEAGTIVVGDLSPFRVDHAD